MAAAPPLSGNGPGGASRPTYTAPKAPVTTTPTRAKTSTVTPTLLQQAIDQANAAYEAEQKPIVDQQTASDAYYKQRQADALANAKALADLLKGIGPATQNTYDTAAQNQDLLANGFSHGLQDKLSGNTDALNATLAKFGSPATLDSHASEAGDVLQGLGGYIPASQMIREGAGFAAAANMLPATALREGGENVKAIAASGDVAHSGFDQKIAELAAKLPGDIQSNYNKLQTLALNDAKFRETVRNNNQKAALAQAKYKTGIDEFNVNTTIKYKQLSLDAQKFSVQQMQSNRTYAISLANLGIAQKNLQMKIAAAAYVQANGGYSKADVRKFDLTMNALLAGGSPTRPGSQTNTNKNGTSGGAPGTTSTGAVVKTPQYQDKNGKWHDIGPDTVVPNNAKVRGNNTYANFITAAIKKGVPVQLAIERANTIWPETQRTLPDALKNLPAVAAQAAQQANDYNQMTGVPNAKGQATLGTTPNGSSIMFQVPKNIPQRVRSTLQNILTLASEYLGTPYVWGGESPSGFDCSGLAQYIYAKSGIQIPRTTYTQFQSGFQVPKNQLQAGDLVFFRGSDSKNGLPGHVGIYIGGGQFIEAPHTGAVVRVSSLSGRADYVGARRYAH